MEYIAETVMPREAMPETEGLFNVTEKIPPEKLHDFFQFMRGVRFGLDMRLDMAGKQPTERPSV